MAEQKSSGLFAAMNKNARLRKNMQKAKTVQASREFSVPDGDYPCVFKRFSTYEKDGTTNVVFEFRTTEDAGEFSNEKIVIFIRLVDGQIRTAEEEQTLMFEMIQLMGIDTTQDDAAIEADLNALAASENAIEMRVKTTTSKKNGQKYKNFAVVGVAAEGKKNPTYTTDTPVQGDEWTEEAPIAPDDAPQAADDEWGDEDAPADAEPNPKDYIGYECFYKGKKCVIINADDTGMCVIEDVKTKRRLSNAMFENLEWPAEE